MAIRTEVLAVVLVGFFGFGVLVMIRDLNFGSFCELSVFNAQTGELSESHTEKAQEE